MHGLVFDFDGLILDTETPELLVWEEVFHAHHTQMPENYWGNMMGRGAEQQVERPAALLTRLAPSFKNSPQEDAARRNRILELIDQQTVRPGILELIDQAEKADVPFGIASSSKHGWVDTYLKKLGLLQRFKVRLCADDVKHAKPFPDLYLKACEQLAINPTKSVALEDSPNGAAAAKAAGLFTIAVPNSVTEKLDLSHADLILPTLAGVSLDDLLVHVKDRS